MKYHAKGQLQHHFWGTYAASIGLDFGTPEAALAALPVLQATAPAWKQGEKYPAVLRWHGTDPEYTRAVAALVRFGASKKKIESVAFSIDYGEVFTVAVETDTTPQPVTQSLFEQMS